jgi:hypothetical protein
VDAQLWRATEYYIALQEKSGFADATDAEERAAMAIATKAEMENFMTGNKWERKKSSVGYYLI